MRNVLAIFGIIALTIFSVAVAIAATAGPKEFTLTDGTRCVSISNAVTCHW